MEAKKDDALHCDLKSLPGVAHMTRQSRKQLEEARERFVHLIDCRAPERSFQELFSQCPYIISSALPVRVAPVDIVPMGTPGRNEPDFVFYPKSDHSPGEFGVIEIKRPDSIIATVTRKNIATLSRDAETAISQCQYFLENLDEGRLMKPKHTLMLGLKGHIFVVMGLSEQLYEVLLNDLTKQQLERRIPANCRLLPYDVVLGSFTKSIGLRAQILVPAIQQTCRVAIMDGSIRHGNGIIGELLSSCIEAVLNVEATITIDDHMEPFVDKFVGGVCDIPVIIFNPEIDEMPKWWPRICSHNAYTATPFLFINNPLADDPDGTRRLKPYIRIGFDYRMGMPYRVPEIAETMRDLIEKRSLALRRSSSRGHVRTPTSKGKLSNNRMKHDQ